MLALIGPIEDAVLTGMGVSAKSVSSFIAIWKERLRTDVHRMAERSTDFLSRTAGIGCARLLLRHADDVLADDAQTLIELISNDRFSIGQKTGVLSLLAERPNLHDLAGRFARHIAEHIGKDDNVEQRGESYAKLASSLVPMSVGEARHYYRQGLAQLDQMGGEDHDRIYSLLHYASVQRGGFVRPDLAQRMMNLCQTVVHQDSGKFACHYSRARQRSRSGPRRPTNSCDGTIRMLPTSRTACRNWLASLPRMALSTHDGARSLSRSAKIMGGMSGRLATVSVTSSVPPSQAIGDQSC
ncbi:hypothetical protein AJ88_46800 [Mesorhizobium amorphae CCBAU 01583]|nr:hypothetical protein AJ88_46800 [Mesorhizobium amorphae CCBAU 01583]